MQASKTECALRIHFRDFHWNYEVFFCLFVRQTHATHSSAFINWCTQHQLLNDIFGAKSIMATVRIFHSIFATIEFSFYFQLKNTKIKLPEADTCTHTHTHNEWAINLILFWAISDWASCYDWVPTKICLEISEFLYRSNAQAVVLVKQFEPHQNRTRFSEISCCCLFFEFYYWKLLNQKQRLNRAISSWFIS